MATPELIEATDAPRETTILPHARCARKWAPHIDTSVTYGKRTQYLSMSLDPADPHVAVVARNG